MFPLACWVGSPKDDVEVRMYGNYSHCDATEQCLEEMWGQLRSCQSAVAGGESGRSHDPFL